MKRNPKDNYYTTTNSMVIEDGDTGEQMIFLIDKCIIVVVSLQVVSFIKLRLAIKLRLCSAAKGVTEFREWQIAQCRVCFVRFAGHQVLIHLFAA